MGTAYKELASGYAGSSRTALFVSNKALASNVATLTTNAVHGLAVGDVVEVAGLGTPFDGTWVVTSVPTTTTLTYACTNANVTGVAVSPVAPMWRTHNLGGVAASNKLCVVATGSAYSLATITVASHTFVVGDWVRVNVGDSTIDGMRQVWAVPSNTLVCFKIVPGAAVASAACGGAVAKMTGAWGWLYGPVPAATAEVMSTIVVCNQGEYTANIRLAVTTSSSTAQVEDVRIWDAALAAGETQFFTIGLAAEAGKYILVNANQPGVSWALYTAEMTP